jgi:hypothetical protein
MLPRRIQASVRNNHGFRMTIREGDGMKRRVFAIAAALLLFALPSMAFEEGQPAQGSGATFEQRKATLLTGIDQRMARLQEVKACVTAATTPEALRTCMGNARGRTGQGPAR